MFRPILHSLEPVTLVGGGQATPEDLHKALTLAPLCVAADGGAELAVRAGVDVTALIGDFDSVSADTLAKIPAARQHRIIEQESTDFEKALTRIDAPLVIGVGFLGARLDHQLAALHVLATVPERPCILLGEEEIACLAPPFLNLPTQEGDTVSLFPFADVQGRSAGLQWAIEGLGLGPTTKIGTSNRAAGPLTLEMEKVGMLLILPRRLMPALVEALMSPAAARWPAPAR
ncbi:thiamine diphosphokinase [Sulfitobacter noctilucicola]|uniref:Thiamine diphosphokinase n=1 Tax=Sulfitobacter noctilucicola TaxID=1342301 RepID=A0A7W6M8J8_9RHOB|nr:thiamine diphosphokinase [Sulfitobacter noctilucicola]MBB4174390.1 thiamine pyrophosphokinase [Sulfitobacter noctilucicola]